MLKGKALIIGPSDTPYADGFYFFRFYFPPNYPHAPPKVEFCTSDGYTRFNPNLYRTGKVCLSILNTWRGEPWSGCQTISSVLLALCTILNDEPLLNEPGVTKSHRDFATYNEIIKYKNIEVAIFGMLASVTAGASIADASESVHAALDNNCVVISHHEFAIFGDIMRDYFQLNKEKIRERVLAALAADGQTIEQTTGIYKLTVKLDYKMLLEKFT
jgi:ubiquitin-protein ligase